MSGSSATLVPALLVSPSTFWIISINSFADNGQKNLRRIQKVDAGTVVPEQVRRDKSQVNSDVLGAYAPRGQAISTV